MRHPIALLSLLLLWPVLLRAEALLLLPGYLGEDDPWRHSGVVATLTDAGWHDGGQLYRTADGSVRASRMQRSSSHTLYTPSLPTTAPMVAQLRELGPQVAWVRQRHAGERLFLVGHSAGGVLGRYYMVSYPESRIAALITIASPHRGTHSADLGRLAADSPLGWLGLFTGDDTLYLSQGLYRDLGSDPPSPFLLWLNRQPHPGGRYISVIREGEWLPLLGELVVPVSSQDMNGIPALRGRSEVIRSAFGHGLVSADGLLLLRLLERLDRL